MGGMGGHRLTRGARTHTQGFPTEDVMTVHLEKIHHNLTTLKKNCYILSFLVLPWTNFLGKVTIIT